jgi:hypothetical protein
MKKLLFSLIVFVFIVSCKKEDDDKYPLYTPLPHFFVDSIYLTPSLYVPSAFSPNYDGINDLFYPFGNGISLVSVVVFNSIESGNAGNEVYIYGRNNHFTYWNGNDLSGNACITGSYPYRIKYVTATGETNVVRGQVQLYRY